MPKQTALIVDDEPDIRELLEITLGRMGLDTLSAATISDAEAQLQARPFDLCLTDMNLPDGNGIDLVSYIQKEFAATPVAVITAYGSMDAAIAALKAGAFDFVSKPVDLSRLRELVATALKLQSRDTATGTAQTSDGPTRLLGESEAVTRLRQRIAKLARSQAPVYISGESGSGKELVARQIHAQGPNAEQPFVPVNCGAIPSELMESELFGHIKGSFTGAVSDKQGLFQAAAGGTLFLDEVADLPLAMQVKLLRAIQEKSVRPVGSESEITVNARILSATHKDLKQQVEDGLFRQDLFYRINVIELPVPPLRERAEDIPLLAQAVLDRLCNEADVPAAALSTEAIRQMQTYPFPGNVRELENIIERAFTLSEEDEIQASDLQLPQSDEQPLATDNPETPDIGSTFNLEGYLEGIERDTINKALEATRWNKTAAAKKLGISFRALRYRLKKLGLD